MSKGPIAVLAAILLGASGGPPWLRPPQGWVIADRPATGGPLRILVVWKEPSPAPGFAQNLSLAVERFGGSIDDYVQATRRGLAAGGKRPNGFRETPFACRAGEARLISYETAAFGFAAHFEQLLVKRGPDVYVATYTRGVEEPEKNEAVSSLRAICR